MNSSASASSRFASSAASRSTASSLRRRVSSNLSAWLPCSATFRLLPSISRLSWAASHLLTLRKRLTKRKYLQIRCLTGVLDLMDDYLPKTQASPLLSRFHHKATAARRVQPGTHGRASVTLSRCRGVEVSRCRGVEERHLAGEAPEEKRDAAPDVHRVASTRLRPHPRPGG